MTNLDFNAVIQIMDTLTEGGYSFVELETSICWSFGKRALHESLEFLISQELVVCWSGESAFPNELPSIEAQTALIKKFNEIVYDDRNSNVRHWIELSEQGELVMKAFGIGHPSLPTN